MNDTIPAGKAKIITIGTFDENGIPKDWFFHGTAAIHLTLPDGTETWGGYTKAELEAVAGEVERREDPQFGVHLDPGFRMGPADTPAGPGSHGPPPTDFNPDKILHLRIIEAADTTPHTPRQCQVIDKTGNMVGWIPIVGYSIAAADQQTQATLLISVHVADIDASGIRT